jgi:hypothetical protein
MFICFSQDAHLSEQSNRVGWIDIDDGGAPITPAAAGLVL